MDSDLMVMRKQRGHYHTPGGRGRGAGLSFSERTVIPQKWGRDGALGSVIYRLGQSLVASLVYHTSLGCSDKNPRILLCGRTEREELWNAGIPATQLPWPGAHKLSKLQQQASCTFSRKGLKRAACWLQTSCPRELCKVSMPPLLSRECSQLGLWQQFLSSVRLTETHHTLKQSMSPEKLGFLLQSYVTGGFLH